MSKFILGTAQFGIPNYGIKHDGQPSVEEIEKIAQVAWDGGIRTIHTSWQYNLPRVCDAIFDGFERVEKDKVNPQTFRWNDKIGYSLYNTDQLKSVFEQMPLIVPANILDKRFLRFKTYNVILIARSVFLQGLLLMDELPIWIPSDVNSKMDEFRIICKSYGLKPYEAALGWVLGLDEIDKVIIGVNSADQLAQLLEVEPLKWDYNFSITDEDVLDPRRWPNAGIS